MSAKDKCHICHREFGYHYPYCSAHRTNLTTDEWVERYAERLRKDLRVHAEVYGVTDVDMPGFLRVCMISIRNWYEDKGGAV